MPLGGYSHLVATATCDSGLTPDLQSFVEEHGRSWGPRHSSRGTSKHILVNRGSRGKSRIFVGSIDYGVLSRSNLHLMIYQVLDGESRHRAWTGPLEIPSELPFRISPCSVSLPWKSWLSRCSGLGKVGLPSRYENTYYIYTECAFGVA